MQVLECPLDMSFGIQLGIVGESILKCAGDNDIDVDIPVGFCHDTSIDAAWFMGGRCTMVFHCLSHRFNLLWGEPLL